MVEKSKEREQKKIFSFFFLAVIAILSVLLKGERVDFNYPNFSMVS